jgi:hypothetical protein
MKCPYQDIGCWHIDDVSHECEARSRNDCPHETREPEPQSMNRQNKEEDE